MRQFSVLLPIIARNAPDQSEVIEVISEPGQPHSGGDHQTIGSQEPALCRLGHLYPSARRAFGAAQKFCANRPWLALYQIFKRRALLDIQWLYPSRPPIVVEGESSDLGLALLLLMNPCRSTRSRIIATGALESTTDDLSVTAIGRLAEKLDLIREWRMNGGGRTQADEEILFFTPLEYFPEEGDHPVGIETLEKKCEELRDIGIVVCPVGSLREAAGLLGITHAPYLPQDRWILRLLTMLAVGAMCLLPWIWWTNHPIPVSFAVPHGMVTAPEPFWDCGPRLPLSRVGNTPELPTGVTLGWRVRVGNSESFDVKLLSHFGVGSNEPRYHVLVALLSQYSPTELKRPKYQIVEGSVTEGRMSPGALWEGTIDLNDTPETSSLMLLAQRTEFDLVALRDRLARNFPKSKGSDPATNVGLSVNSAEEFLMNSAPGAVAFMFRTVRRERECAMI